MKKIAFVTALILTCIQFLRSQDEQVVPQLKFFESAGIFPRLVLNPLESDIRGGAYLLPGKNGDQGRMISIVNLGFSIPIVNLEKAGLDLEAGIEAISYTQFEVLNDPSQDKLIGGLLNTDYRVGGYLAGGRGNSLARIRFFHNSSHLGDDYLIRNNITEPNDRSANYEQADITMLHQFRRGLLYAGAGYVVSRFVYRDRWSAWIGGRMEQEYLLKKISLFEAINIRRDGKSEGDPSVRIAAGLEIPVGNRDNGLRIWLESFSGYLPYGTIFKNRVFWTGIGGSLKF